MAKNDRYGLKRGEKWFLEKIFSPENFRDFFSVKSGNCDHTNCQININLNSASEGRTDFSDTAKCLQWPH